MEGHGLLSGVLTDHHRPGTWLPADQGISTNFTPCINYKRQTNSKYGSACVNIHVVTETVQVWQFWNLLRLEEYFGRNSFCCAPRLSGGQSVAGSLFVFHYNNIMSPACPNISCTKHPNNIYLHVRQPKNIFKITSVIPSFSYSLCE